MRVSVRVGREYVWSAHSVFIQVERHNNIELQAPLENKVMQIVPSHVLPATNKKDSDSLKVRTLWNIKKHTTNKSLFVFAFFISSRNIY